MGVEQKQILLKSDKILIEYHLIYSHIMSEEETKEAPL